MRTPKLSHFYWKKNTSILVKVFSLFFSFFFFFEASVHTLQGQKSCCRLEEKEVQVDVINLVLLIAIIF